MSLLDDIVDGLAGSASASVSERFIEHGGQEFTEVVIPEPPVQQAPTQGIKVRILVEVVDTEGNVGRASHQTSVPKGTIVMMEMLSDDGDLLDQIAKSTVVAAAKSITPQPGTRGGGAVLEHAAAAPGPIGGRTKPAGEDKLASMLGLDIIEHANALDHGNPRAQGPRAVPRQPQPMGGPHTTGPRPGASHPRR